MAKYSISSGPYYNRVLVTGTQDFMKVRRVDAGVNAWANKGIEFDANGVAQPVDIGAGAGITELTGDVTAGPGSGSEVATIANDVVTNAKAANMVQATIKGRASGAGTGDPTDLTANQTSTILDSATDPFLRTSAAGAGGINQLTGDVTSGPGTGSQAATIANDVVTYAKIQNVTATDRILGRSTGGAGDVEEIPCTAAGRALLDDVDAAAQRTTLALGTLATQSGTFSGTSSGTNTGDQTITLTGNVTGSGTGSFAATIAAAAVTLAKMADVATGTLFYRKTAGTGVPEVQTLATLKTDLGLTGTNSGDQTITLTGGVTGSGTGSFAATVITNANLTGGVTSVGNAATVITNANLTGDVTSVGNASTIANDVVTYAKMQNVSAASKLLGRGDSGSGDTQEITLGTNLTMSGTTLNAASGGGSANVGATTVDFGAFPGASDTSVAVTGQAGIVAGSKVNAWLVATASADHSADEHVVESVQVMAGNISNGVGFTIYARNNNWLSEQVPVTFGNRMGPGISTGTTTPALLGTRLYGRFTVHWQWV